MRCFVVLLPVTPCLAQTVAGSPVSVVSVVHWDFLNQILCLSVLCDNMVAIDCSKAHLHVVIHVPLEVLVPWKLEEELALVAFVIS